MAPPPCRCQQSTGVHPPSCRRQHPPALAALPEMTPTIRRPSDVHSHTLPDGRLSVECWCRRGIYYVLPEVVQQRRTVSCGRRDCQAPPTPQV